MRHLLPSLAQSFPLPRRVDSLVELGCALRAASGSIPIVLAHGPSIHEEALKGKKEKPPIIVISGKWGSKPNEIEGRVENAGRSKLVSFAIGFLIPPTTTTDQILCIRFGTSIASLTPSNDAAISYNPSSGERIEVFEKADQFGGCTSASCGKVYPVSFCRHRRDFRCFEIQPPTSDVERLLDANGEDWCKNARCKLVDKTRMALESAQKLEDMMAENDSRSLIEVELMMRAMHRTMPTSLGLAKPSIHPGRGRVPASHRPPKPSSRPLSRIGLSCLQKMMTTNLSSRQRLLQPDQNQS